MSAPTWFPVCSRRAFVSARWGIASAQSILLFVMVGALTLAQFRIAGRRVFYG